MLFSLMFFTLLCLQFNQAEDCAAKNLTITPYWESQEDDSKENEVVFEVTTRSKDYFNSSRVLLLDHDISKKINRCPEILSYSLCKSAVEGKVTFKKEDLKTELLLDCRYILKMSKDCQSAYEDTCTFSAFRVYTYPNITSKFEDQRLKISWDSRDLLDQMKESNIELHILIDSEERIVSMNESTKTGTFTFPVKPGNKTTTLLAFYKDKDSQLGYFYRRKIKKKKEKIKNKRKSEHKDTPTSKKKSEHKDYPASKKESEHKDDPASKKESEHKDDPASKKKSFIVGWIVFGGFVSILSLLAVLLRFRRKLFQRNRENGMAVATTRYKLEKTFYNPWYFDTSQVKSETDQLQPEMIIDKHELKYIDKLGEGNFGRVELNLWLVRDMKVAVKYFKSTPQNDVSQFEKEVEIFKIVGYHPNIIKFLGYNIEPWFIVTEYMELGDLENYLKHLRKQFSESRTSGKIPDLSRENGYIRSDEIEPFLPNDFTCKDVEFFGKEIAKGMAHLELHGIVHRDLAARNVLLGKKRSVKITDFGLSREGTYINSKKAELPIRWMAPETFEGKRMHCSKSDVWSFGVLLWEISTIGDVPYEDMTMAQLMAFVKEGNRLPKPPVATNSQYNLMRRCWHQNYSLRPSFQEIVKEFEQMSQYVDICE